MNKIIGTIKQEGTNKILEYMFEDETTLSVEEAIKQASVGTLEGYEVRSNQYGPYLRSTADGDKSNNISNTVTFR